MVEKTAQCDARVPVYVLGRNTGPPRKRSPLPKKLWQRTRGESHGQMQNTTGEMVQGPRTTYPSPARPRQKPRRGARGRSTAQPHTQASSTHCGAAAERKPRGRTAAPRPRGSPHREHSGAAAERGPQERTAAQTTGGGAHRPARAGQAAGTGRRARAGHTAHAQGPPASRGGARGPRECNHRAHWECGNESSSWCLSTAPSPRHKNTSQELSTAQENFSKLSTAQQCGNQISNKCKTVKREKSKCFRNSEAALK
jgi:hypothetical protein